MEARQLVTNVESMFHTTSSLRLSHSIITDMRINVRAYSIGYFLPTENGVT